MRTVSFWDRLAKQKAAHDGGVWGGEDGFRLSPFEQI